MQTPVRPATPEDAAEVVALIKLLAADNGDTTALTVDYARIFLSGAERGVLLVETDGAIAGLLSYSLRPGLYHAAPSLVLEDLVVRPAFRRQGLAKRLLAEAVALGHARGCAEISVSTALDNQPAQALYRSAGLTDESLLLERHF